MASRFERIILKESEKDCTGKSLAAGFNVQVKGKHRKCGQYWHKSDSPKGPENQETDGNKNPSRGDSKSGLNVSRRSKTRCQNFLFIRDLIVLKVKM